MKNSMGDEGEFAILSATSQATNQNAWIEEMKIEFAKPEYSKMKWVDTVYGDDLFDKSYQEALGLFKKYPNLKKLPDQLEQSLENLKKNKSMIEAFGKETINSYLKLRNSEVEEFKQKEIFDKTKTITKWERINTLDC